MRILVTGGAGNIGSHATRLFLERGHEVWAYDNLSFGHAAAIAQGRFVIADLADSAVLEKILGRPSHRGGRPFRRLRLCRRVGPRSAEILSE